MKKLIHGRKRVIILAAAIVMLSAVLFIGSAHIAMGAEENKTVSQQSTYAAANTPQVTGEAVITDDPGQEFITGEQAVDAYTWTATELFGVSVDKSALTVKFNSEQFDGVVHSVWRVYSPDYDCSVDAVTGTVIHFDVISGTYPGSSITLGDFNSKFDGDIRGNPDNIYITAARELVTSKLAGGREIDYIEIDGIGFDWDDDENGGFEPEETGTISVDCHVYMETGMCYTLTYWGTDEIALNRFFSNPTKQACQAGFYYLEQADDFPPYGWKGAGHEDGIGEPGSEFITEQNAKSEAAWTASNIFDLSVEESKLYATFEAAHNLIDNKGAIYGIVHDNWQVAGSYFSCRIDALTGDLLSFSLDQGRKYADDKITLAESNTDKYCSDIADDPNNPYSKLAADIVTSKLANGRAIEKAAVNAIQFVWDNNSEGFEPDAKGTIQVDVHVFMETGRCYNFSFWGTKHPELRIFSSHPTKDACTWGYFYEDQAEEYSGHA